MSAILRVACGGKAFGEKEVRGGSMVYTDSDEPNGFVRDATVFYVTAHTMKSVLTEEQYIAAVKAAVDTLYARGYTNYADGYINAITTDEAIFEAIKAVDDAGELTINMSTNYGVRSSDDYKGKVDYVAGLVDKYNSEHVNVANIKLFADGVTDVGTGWIFEEYKNTPEGREHGNQEWTQDELKILTINGAWQLGLEEERGSIKVGKYADFVIIDRNILEYSGEQLRTIHEAKITDTYFEGKKVY